MGFSKAVYLCIHLNERNRKGRYSTKKLTNEKKTMKIVQLIKFDAK